MLTRVVGLAVLVLASLAAPASAATIIVNTDLDDDVPSGTFCTLREAVQSANTNTGVGGCNGDTAGHDTIQLTVGHLYRLTNTFTHENDNLYGDLDISGPTTITTVGGMSTIAGKLSGDRDRVIHVESTAGSVTVERVKIQDGFLNSGVGGGGILNDAPLTLIDSEITGNRVEAPGATFGGGIYTRGPLGTLTITGSTIAANVGQVVSSADTDQTVGGGIAAYNAAPSVSITNSTISGNQARGVTAVGPGIVGGAFLGDGTPSGDIPATLDHNTITLNTATIGGALTGGLQIVNGTMTGNIVAGNTADSGAQDCFGGPTSSGGANILGKSDAVSECGFFLTGSGDLVGTSGSPVNANLGGLINNGGLTRTHAPNQASPAVNRGGTCPATDQRGRFRFNVLPCDSGSVELGASTTPPPPPPPPSPTVTPIVLTPVATGQRAAALAKCKKKKTKKKRKKCRKRAQLLPV